MTQSVSSPASLLPGDESIAAPVAVLRVRDDAAGADNISARLDAVADTSVEAVATPATARSHLDGVDCVVCDADVPDEELLELLETIRLRGPDLPFVLVASAPSHEVVEALFQTPWTDCLDPERSLDETHVLARRIHVLVGYRRTMDLARRALAAVDQSTDAVAIVAPDDTVEFVNPLLARKLDATAEALVGRGWRTLYPDSEVDRLETDAFPSLDDGWRWVGDCEMRRSDGSTVAVQTRIDALDDGSLVFTVSDRPSAD